MRLLLRVLSKLKLSAFFGGLMCFVDAAWHWLAGDHSTANILAFMGVVLYVLGVVGEAYGAVEEG